MNNLKKIFLFSILSILTIVTLAQKDSSKIKLSGKIINIETSLPISFAHILIPERNLGTAADENGEFSISIHKNDIVVFSAIGFQIDRLCLADSSDKNECFFTIKLLPEVYQIQAVNILPYKNYKDFKQVFIEHEKTPNEVMLDNLTESINEDNLAAYAPCNLGISPITFLYTKFSKVEKSKRLFAQLTAEDEQRERNEKKFSSHLIRTMTQIEDENLINEFMKFCSFHPDFIDNSTEIELLDAISQCYDEFEDLDLD